MSPRRYGYTTRVFRFGETGSDVLQVYRYFDLDVDGGLWNTHVLRISFAFESTNPAQLLSLDFLDPDVRLLEGAPTRVRKRVLVDDSGTTLSFVSDCLGHGWAVPPRSNGGEPMGLLFEADGGGGNLGASAIVLEHWWEARAVSRCSDDS